MSTAPEAQVYTALESGLAIGVAGLVNRTDWAVHILFGDGTYRYDWPDQGLIGDFTEDRSRYLGCWGVWRRDGAAIEIARPDTEPTRFLQEGDALVHPDGRRFEQVTDRQTVAALSGLWHREASAGAAPAIMFREGNRFETAGGLLGLIAEPRFVLDFGTQAGRTLFQWPDTGGSYTLYPFTILLERDDGARLSLLRWPAGHRMRLGYTWFRPDPA